MAVPLSRVEIRWQQDRGPAAAGQRRVAAADRMQTGVQAGLVKIGLRTQHDRVGNRAKTGFRAEQWWPDEAASSGVVGQVAAAQRRTASGRRGTAAAGSSDAALNSVWAARNNVREVRNNLRVASGRRGTAAAGSSDAARNIVSEVRNNLRVAAGSSDVM